MAEALLPEEALAAPPRMGNMRDNVMPEAAKPGFKQQKNMYVCERCAGHIVTVDLEEGVTPFLIKCEATAGCSGMMKSSMYRVYDQSVRASHEWYRPTLVMRLDAWEQEHVKKGGLLLRRIAQPASPPKPGRWTGLRALLAWMAGAK
jgi:hypothetical protein